MDTKAELSVEMRRARNWILGVGVLIFVIDELLVQVVSKNEIAEAWRTRFLVSDSVLLVYFVSLYLLARVKPKLACILALAGYWGAQIGFAIYNGDFTLMFTQGILIKILFTAALIQGYKSADRAQSLKEQLEKVFG